MTNQAELYVLEFNEKHNFPFHIRRMFDGRHVNHFFDTDAHGWHIIFVGKHGDCENAMDELLKLEPSLDKTTW